MSVDLLASAGVISRSTPLYVDHLGPVVEPVTVPDADPTAPGLARGTIRGGGFVPMHSHSDGETFYLLDGALEGLTFTDRGTPRWVPLLPGEVLHVPPDARHALRNTADVAATALIISSMDLVRFFAETGRPLRSRDDVAGPPTPADIERMVATAIGAGHWLASPEENAAVGIQLPVPPE